MTIRELQMLQALPLEIKIMKSKQRIKEWVETYGESGVYISYSGGKDSEVLVDIAREEYPNIKVVFVNTGVELPKTIKQVLKRKRQGWNMDIIQPKKRFHEIIREYGYPVISKEQSQYISEIKESKSQKLKDLRLNGGGKTGKSFKIAEKWKYLIDSDFKISHKCCEFLKKEPIYRYNKETSRKAITAVMASESRGRMRTYLKVGCNSFEQKNPQSRPLGFWTEQDIWEYIKVNNLEISEEYTKNGRCRTGCYGCLFGCHLEEKETGTNRILELKKTYPKLFNYLMNDLNYKHVMETLGLRTFEIEQLNLFKKK